MINKMSTKQRIYLPFKRLIGIIGSILGIIVCFILFWWWIIPINTFVTKGHPFFVHKRIGKDKKAYNLLKFRSMSINANPNLSPSDMDISSQESMETCFGKFLRKSSLDETPQLFNILIGQMAFIGPRPGAAINEEELIEEREKYTPNAYVVKPGLSGLAQIKMRRDHDPVLKAKFDHEYVLKISFWLDLKLFFRTLTIMFNKRDGTRSNCG